MYRRNTAGQNVGFVLVDRQTGMVLAGATVVAYRVVDGGDQEAVTGFVVEKGNGQYNFVTSADDTDGSHVSFLFTAPTAFPVEKTVVTTAADPNDGTRFGLSALPLVAAGETGGLPVVTSGGAVPATLVASALDAVLVAAGIDSARYVDPDGVPVTTINLRQALAVILAGLAGDRSGVGTREVSAAVPNQAARVTAARTSRTVIEATIVVPP